MNTQKCQDLTKKAEHDNDIVPRELKEKRRNKRNHKLRDRKSVSSLEQPDFQLLTY